MTLVTSQTWKEVKWLQAILKMPRPLSDPETDEATFTHKRARSTLNSVAESRDKFGFRTVHGWCNEHSDSLLELNYRTRAGASESECRLDSIMLSTNQSSYALPNNSL